MPYQLDESHLQALRWFEHNAGLEFAQRPFDVGLPIKVTSLQKGIWKPAHVPYAVSVVQTHKGIYDDQDPLFFDDATWKYFYHQQGKTAEDYRDPNRLYANTALFACMRDRVPVGVIIPAEDGRELHQLRVGQPGVLPVGEQRRLDDGGGLGHPLLDRPVDPVDLVALGGELDVQAALGVELQVQLEQPAVGVHLGADLLADL